MLYATLYFPNPLLTCEKTFALLVVFYPEPFPPPGRSRKCDYTWLTVAELIRINQLPCVRSVLCRTLCGVFGMYLMCL